MANLEPIKTCTNSIEPINACTSSIEPINTCTNSIESAIADEEARPQFKCHHNKINL